MSVLAASYRGRVVLITGDTGFKGSWLAIWLRELGAEVIGFALPPVTPRDNFAVCGLAQRLTHIDGDVRNYAHLADVLAKHQPEVVFHLAAQAVVLTSYENPRETFETNVMGVVNLLEAVRHTPSVRAVVVVTSDKCYENHEEDRGYRETDPLGGKDPYSASKGAAEIVASSMQRSFFSATGAAAIATARAGNVIGGGDWAPHRIIPDCIRALLSGEPIVIRNPTAIRPWQHVLDALHGYLVLGARLLDGGASYAEAWNFGPNSGESVNVLALVQQIVSVWGEGSYRIGDTTRNAPSEAKLLQLEISKARARLDWAPRLPLRQAITMTVEGYRAELKTTAEVYAHRFQQLSTFGALS